MTVDIKRCRLENPKKTQDQCVRWETALNGNGMSIFDFDCKIPNLINYVQVECQID